jgi:DNA (cytosine-5)-methyltransferase 1
MSGAYYNEIDPYAAQWLRNLIAGGHIAPGDVDERSIVDVHPGDLSGYTQCHFFAGLGGWQLGLRIAGWPDDRPVWTGSCPCQPFSQQGARKGFDDHRHLWPHLSRLIGAERPPVFFGEQVTASAEWLDAVRSDLGSMVYDVGVIPVEAASAGAFHLRDRFWIVADTARPGGRRGPALAERGRQEPRGSGSPLCLIPRPIAGRGSSPLRVSDVLCPSYGVPGRVAQLRAFGNAIVPQVAAEVIGAFLDIERAAA